MNQALKQKEISIESSIEEKTMEINTIIDSINVNFSSPQLLNVAIIKDKSNEEQINNEEKSNFRKKDIGILKEEVKKKRPRISFQLVKRT
jgi:hypothetical protein